MANKNSGIVHKLNDGRIVLKKHDQPLQSQKRIVLYLLNEDFSFQYADGKEKTLVKNFDDYKQIMQGSKMIAFYD